jgi:hypothetical protein
MCKSQLMNNVFNKIQLKIFELVEGKKMEAHFTEFCVVVTLWKFFIYVHVVLIDIN